MSLESPDGVGSTLGEVSSANIAIDKVCISDQGRTLLHLLVVVTLAPAFVVRALVYRLLAGHIYLDVAILAQGLSSLHFALVVTILGVRHLHRHLLIVHCVVLF